MKIFGLDSIDKIFEDKNNIENSPNFNLFNNNKIKNWEAKKILNNLYYTSNLNV